VRGRRPDR